MGTASMMRFLVSKKRAFLDAPGFSRVIRLPAAIVT